MSDSYFADTWYWIALLNRADAAHDDVVGLYEALENDTIVTSHMVLDEVLSTFTKAGTAHLRPIAALLVDDLRADPGVVIIEQTADQFGAALSRYKRFHDKLWSLTDCSSMSIMEQLGITVALTQDHHFEQAGFQRRTT